MCVQLLLEFVQVAELPAAVGTGKTITPEFLELRREALEQFLHRLLQHRHWRCSVQVIYKKRLYLRLVCWDIVFFGRDA